MASLPCKPVTLCSLFTLFLLSSSFIGENFVNRDTKFGIVRELKALLRQFDSFFGEAPSMGREPMNVLSPLGKVHTWLHWPIQPTPRPETQHACQAKTMQKMASMAHPAHPSP
eukprot:1155625-Pelagomonas_calceolata.AAC.1